VGVDDEENREGSMTATTVIQVAALVAITSCSGTPFNSTGLETDTSSTDPDATLLDNANKDQTDDHSNRVLIDAYSVDVVRREIGPEPIPDSGTDFVETNDGGSDGCERYSCPGVLRTGTGWEHSQCGCWCSLAYMCEYQIDGGKEYFCTDLGCPPR